MWTGIYAVIVDLLKNGWILETLKKSRKLLVVSIRSYRSAGFSDIQLENVEHYHVMNED